MEKTHEQILLNHSSHALQDNLVLYFKHFLMLIEKKSNLQKSRWFAMQCVKYKPNEKIHTIVNVGRLLK